MGRRRKDYESLKCFIICIDSSIYHIILDQNEKIVQNHDNEKTFSCLKKEASRMMKKLNRNKAKTRIEFPCLAPPLPEDFLKLSPFSPK
ncbi:hypothetical protein TRFO_42125 [Tritrichomonas foetus]|uniref:Uncharacterized protein n=1 Tax=Tritrichomonas foetus TaxID=1144522 RepID=A0A1J4KXU5_9EUKA|nr:hypothetical protein TRFO_42125 [Tritrichomonas foetus]|eukprot:OHT16002.1 hypothetical protein TRFO_42125 [Tritrichomonas foetus]